MKICGKLPDFNDLSNLGIKNISSVHWNLTTKELTDITINNGMGILASSGALCVKTGKFTGRSPKDRFIVKDDVTEETVWWGEVNIPFDTSDFNKLYQRAMNYLKHKEIYVRDVYACSLKKYQLKIRVINEYPWSNHFVSNMFHD